MDDTTLRTEDGRQVLRLRRVLPHPPAKVWRAVTDPAHLAHWFPSRIAMTPAVGEKITFTSPGPTPEGEGVITEWDEPRVFAFTWNNDAFRIELIPAAGGCELIFTHTFDDRVAAGSFAAGWRVCLDTLAARLSGDPDPEMAPETYAAWHEDFHARFTPLSATARRDGDHWTLRVERLIPFHAGVRQALTEGCDPVAGQPVPVRFTNPHVPPGRVTDVTDVTDVTAPAASGDGPDGDPAGDPAGEVTDVRDHTRSGAEGAWTLAYRSDAGEVRWRLTPVPQGTRVLITHTVPDGPPGPRAAALAAWHVHLDLLAAQMRGHEVCPWPADRTAALARDYRPSVT